MIIDENERKIHFNQSAIPFQIKKGKRSNRISLSVKETGILHIITGSGTLSDFDKQFIRKQHKWILKHYGTVQQASDRKNEFLKNIDKEIFLLGQLTPVLWKEASRTSFHYKASEGLSMFAPKHLIEDHKKEVLFFGLRALAAQKLPKMLHKWAETCELSINRVVVKDISSRWGSCSIKRNINLNWQLIFLDEKLIEYVIIHELMHLHEMNHSKAFWDWVGKYCPDYKVLRKQIKDYQWMIGILK